MARKLQNEYKFELIYNRVHNIANKISKNPYT